jgi:PAS domain S-box-containing protein
LQWIANRFALAFERAQLFEALREEKQREHAMLEAALDCIVVMDGQGRIVEFNPAAEKTFGYQRQEVIGQPLADCIIPPALRQKHQQGLEQYLSTNEGPVLNTRIEITGMRANGSEFPVELAIVPLHLRDEVLFTGYIRDITERREAEAQKEQLLAQEQQARTVAEAANRAKDEFLAVVSHELRTPLTPIIGWISLLQSNSQQYSSPEAMQQALGIIERNARSQLGLINDLLDVSRIVTGKLALDVRAIELHPVIDAALETVAPAASAKGIKVRTFIDRDAGMIKGDPDRLQQVVWNLLSNAIKFTPKTGRVEVHLEKVDSSVQLTVSDNGQGIDPQFLPYVFDRFLQADSSNTRQHGGLGLGLSIVRHLVDAHGGDVKARSAGIGQGALFEVRLPRLAVIPENLTDSPTTINANIDFIHRPLGVCCRGCGC